MESKSIAHRFALKWKPIERKLNYYGGFIPLSWSGLALALGLGTAVKYLGLKKLDMVALAGGVGLLACLVLSMVAVLIGALWLRRCLSKVDTPTYLELVSGDRVMSGFALKVGWFLPLVRVSWEVKDLEAQVDRVSSWGLWDEYITCHRRGLQSGLTRRFQVTDTLGLASFCWDVHFPGKVRVLPTPGKLESPDILLSLVSGEDLSDPRGDPQGDRVDMRQYQKGDPMKFILWKVYSRSGKVMVRVPERALAARPRACCYLVSGPHDEASAALARVLLELGLLGEEWRFGADGTPGHCNTLHDALDMVARSGNVAESDGKNFQEYLSLAEKDGFGFCIVLAPPMSDRVVENVDHCLSRSRMRSDIWAGIDLSEETNPKWYHRFSFLQAEGITPEAAHKTWKGRATIVARGTGQVMRKSQDVGR